MNRREFLGTVGAVGGTVLSITATAKPKEPGTCGELAPVDHEAVVWSYEPILVGDILLCPRTDEKFLVNNNWRLGRRNHLNLVRGYTGTDISKLDPENDALYVIGNVRKEG